MKNIYKILFFIAIGIISGCYDDYRNDYAYTTVAFSNATGGATTPHTLFRTVVMGEGLKLDAGIYLAGVRNNNRERWANFVIDESLLEGTPYELMPEEYYTLSNTSRFIIPAGDFIGRVTITLDSSVFVNDKNAAKYHYAIPFRLIESSEDSILITQSTQILVIKYINHFEGYYEHQGSFVTISDDGTELNKGTINNALLLSTVMLDTVRTNGLLASLGDNFMMTICATNKDRIFIEYFPNPNPVEPTNIALTAKPSTDYVSPWENLYAINDGAEPANSKDRSGPKGIYGNWNSAGIWRYVQYDFDRYYKIDKSDVYWFTDEGGLLFPDEIFIEYWDSEREEWVEVPNPEGYGTEGNMWNITTFDPVVTNKIRMHFRNGRESCGIIEWRVWGVPAPVGLEEAEIEKVTPIGVNSYDPEKNTFTLNYRVDYLDNDYYTEASVTLKWRNRIRDGVNEWKK